MTAPLAIGGNRLPWRELPEQVRRAVTDAAGAPVVEAVNRPGGFSPGLASVLRLADGRSVFVKATCAARHPRSPHLHRREARILAQLPADVPAPRLLWTYDDGDWVALMTEAVDGHNPVQPWRPEELTAFRAVAVELVERLTPAPFRTPRVADLTDRFSCWQRLAGGQVSASVDPWTRAHLDRLAELESRAPVSAEGDTLLHGDLRADNVVLTAAGALVVDWPSVTTGAGWIDFLFAVPSVSMHGGGAPESLWADYPPARDADPDAVNAVLAAACGYHLVEGSQPAPRNNPRMRPFQRAIGAAGLAWLQRRLA